MKLAGKNIVLTGASSGIGKEMLNILSSMTDAKIIAVARHIENIPFEEGVIYPFAADVSMPEGVDNVFDYAQRTLGNIDVFIANAGFAYLEKLSVPDWKHIEYIYNLNVFSPIYSLEKLQEQSNGLQATFVCTISVPFRGRDLLHCLPTRFIALQRRLCITLCKRIGMSKKRACS